MIDPTTFEDVIYEVRGRAAWIIDSTASVC